MAGGGDDGGGWGDWNPESGAGGIDYGAGGGSGEGGGGADWSGGTAIDYGAGGGSGWKLPDFGGAGKSWGDSLSGFAKSLGIGSGPGETSPFKAFSSALGLGTAGMGIANQFKLAGQSADQAKFLKQGQESAQAAAAPAVAFGRESLTNARAGKLSAPGEARIAQFVQQAKADMRAKYASMGLGNSSDLAGQDAKIDQMALAMREQLIQQEAQLGLEGLNTGVSAGLGGAGVAGQQQDFLANLIAGANKQLGLLSGNAA